MLEIIRKGREIRNLDARSAEDANGRASPRDLLLQVIQPFPGLIGRKESRNVDDFAATSKIDNPLSSLLVRVRARVRCQFKP